MTQEREISQEMQSAFVDGQLDQAEWARIAARLQQDEGARAEICDLRALKELVRHAYEPPPGGRPAVSLGTRWAAVAALCAVSAAAGWVGRSAWLPDAVEVEHAVAAGSSLRAVAGDRILVHVSSSRRDLIAAALDEIEDVLRSARQRGRGLNVEIIANGPGLELLRADASGFSDRLAALRATYPGFTLVACAQTIERLREKGVAVRLLPGVQVAPSALDQVVRRLQGGWAYVRT
ncbi:MAG: hypothetical protein EPO27_00355 [Betaproteobacteria bacterium]|nr:MAG: hypothetical protein EPO27_00355 [Betaproteobacteria bacterium]